MNAAEITVAALMEVGRMDLALWIRPGRSGAPMFDREVVGELPGMAGIPFEDYLVVARAIDVGRVSAGLRPTPEANRFEVWEYWQTHTRPVVAA